MTELSQQTQTRVMTDIAFGEALAAAAAFSLAVAEGQADERRWRNAPDFDDTTHVASQFDGLRQARTAAM